MHCEYIIILYMLFHTICFADVDECTDGSHNCAQLCYDTSGSFACACRSGYTLASDGRSCNGTYRIYLLHAAIDNILLLTLNYNYNQ